MERCAVYIRVSTEEQKIHGLSVEAQKENLKEYADKHDLEIVDYYIDAGLTARKRLSHRKEMQRLLLDVENGLVDIIIFTKLDRWFRNIADYYKVQEILDKYKVNWKTIFEDYDTSNANGRLHINIMLSIAQDEADRTSERIKVVFENKRSRGETPAWKAPLGYKIINSKLLINEDTKQIAIDIFNYYDLHHSLNGCVRLAREKYDYKIYDYSINRMFKNKTYIGEFKGYKDFCDPLIDQDLFYRIQDYRGIREFKNQLVNGRTYLFASLVFCEECKHNMSACTTKRSYGEYHYYRCREAIVNKSCGHSNMINEEKIEDYLLHHIEAELKKKIFTIEEQKRHNVGKRIDTVKIKKRLEKLKDLYLDDLIDKESYKLEYDNLTTQLNNSPTFKPATIEKYKDYIKQDIVEFYKNITKQEQKAFWLGLIDRIIVNTHNEIEFFFK